MRWTVLVLLAGLGGCTQPGSGQTQDTRHRSALEAAAIARGVIADPDSTDLAGLYARDDDRVCIVPGEQDYVIGAVVAFEDGQGCEARGIARRAGDRVRVRFDTAEGCTFDLAFDGDTISFPAELPPACELLCRGRASFSALSVGRLSDSTSEARTLRGRKGQRLCGGAG